jgi:hypothetical protein
MEMQEMIESLLAGQAKAEADRKADQEKADANTKAMTRSNPETIESNTEAKETVLEQHDIPNEEVTVHSLKECRSEKAAYQEATETKPDPEMMQSVEEHQEMP